MKGTIFKNFSIEGSTFAISFNWVLSGEITHFSEPFSSIFFLKRLKYSTLASFSFLFPMKISEPISFEWRNPNAPSLPSHCIFSRYWLSLIASLLQLSPCQNLPPLPCWCISVMRMRVAIWAWAELHWRGDEGRIGFLRLKEMSLCVLVWTKEIWGGGVLVF